MGSNFGKGTYYLLNCICSIDIEGKRSSLFKMKYLGRIFLIIIAWIMCKINAETYEECAGITMLTFVANSKNCSKYIFCDGEDSYEGDCDEGDYFNSIYQTCDAKEMVQCRFDDNSNEQQAIVTPTTSDIIILTTEALESIDTAIPITRRTTTITRTTTTEATTTTPKKTPTTTRSTTITTNSQSLIWAVTSAADGETCPLISDPYRIFYIRNPKSCSDYLICYRGLSIKMLCPGMLHFNAATGKCDYPEISKCDVYLQASAREKCQPNRNDYYPHDSNCNYFYHCKSGFLFLEHCPLGYGWDYVKRVCTKLNLANCYKKRELL